MQKKNNVFPDELKLKYVQEWLNTDISLKDLKKKYGVGSNDCLYQWMRKFGFLNPKEKLIKVHTTMSKEPVKTDNEKQLEVKVRQLEKELEYEKLRTHALDKMIDIAERDLKIPIRKKSGTRQ
jgi:transposase-like protein